MIRPGFLAWSLARTALRRSFASGLNSGFAFDVKIEPRQLVAINDGLIFEFQRGQIGFGNGQFRAAFAAEGDNHIAAALADGADLVSIKVLFQREPSVPGRLVLACPR